MPDGTWEELIRKWANDIGLPLAQIRAAADRVQEQLVFGCAEYMMKDCRNRQKSMLSVRKVKLRGFRKRNTETWGVPFDTFDALIVGSTEIGAEINGKIRGSGQTKDVAKAEAITRLHARANQIANEILWLCRGGFADGAMARWRSLHEVAVVSVFIADHEEDLAKIYLDFEAIETKRAADQYEEYCDQLEFDHLGEAAVEVIRKASEELAGKHDVSMRGNYGWASGVLSKNNPHFFDIEMACKLTFVRPFYKYASCNIHANPKGIFHKLGLALTQEDILLAG